MSYKYEVSKSYTYKSNYQYRARVGVKVVSETAEAYTIDWIIEVQALHGYLYGMAVTGSGECSGTVSGYLTSSPGSTWKTVKSKTGRKGISKGRSKRTIKFIAKAYGKTVDGYGSAGGSGVTATYNFTVDALDSYKITYDLNGGKNGPDTQTKYYGSPLQLSSVKPEKTGYTFSGWYTQKTGGSKYGTTYTANRAATLYAHWAPIFYTIRYDSNGGNGSILSDFKPYGSAVNLANGNNLSRNGYSFKNWNTKSDGTGKSYSAGITYSDNANLTLYAQWRKNTYTVTYDWSNYISGGKTTRDFTVNQSFPLISNPLSGSSTYNFLGWKINNKTYKAGQSYTSSEYKDIVFTAVATEIKASTTIVPIQITNVQINRCTTDSGNAQNVGGWAYKYSFDWECGKLLTYSGTTLQSTTNKTPTTIVITDDNGYSRNFINESTSTSGSCGDTIVTDLKNASTLIITATYTGTSSEEESYDSEVEISIPYSDEEIEEITLSNITLYRSTKKISGSFNWSTYFDGNTIHTNYIFQILAKIGNEENYTNSLSISPISKSKTDANNKINFEANLENIELEEDEEIELAVKITSSFSLDGTPYSKEHNNLILGIAEPLPTIIHLNSSGNGIGLFTKVTGLQGFRVNTDSFLLGSLEVDKEVSVKSNINVINGSIILPNNQGINLKIKEGTSYKALYVSTNNNLILGYPWYTNSIGNTAIYGKQVNIYTKDSVSIDTPLIVNGSITLPNTPDKGLKIKDKNGVVRNALYVTSANNIVLGYPWYHGDTAGNMYLGGDKLYLRARDRAYLNSGITFTVNDSGIRGTHTNGSTTYVIGYVSSNNNVVIGDSNTSTVIRGNNKRDGSTYILNSNGDLTLNGGIYLNNNVGIHAYKQGSTTTQYDLISVSANNNVLVGDKNSSGIYLYGMNSSSSSSGNVRVGISNGSSTGFMYYLGSSSKRYKHDIQNLEISNNKSLLNPSRLYDLPVRTFKYNNDYLSSNDLRSNKDIPGFIAEEVGEVYPIAMDRDEDGLPEDWNVRYIVPPMLALIQQQKKQIDKLEKRVAELEK